MGAGAFVCGEESALIASLEGRRGMPQPASAVPGAEGLPGQADHASTTWRRWPTCPLILDRGRGGTRPSARDGQQGHQDLRPGRQGEQHRPGRSADGRHAARDHLRHRRRHPEEPPLQGRADRRAVRRLPAGEVPRPADRLRLRQGGRRDHGLRRPDRHGREHLHGRTSPASSSSSSRASPAASACPAASARATCSTSSQRICTGEGRDGRPRRAGAAGPADQGRRRSAAWGRRRPTRCSPRSATSATSTRSTSCGSTAAPRSARGWSTAPCSHACPAEVNVPQYVGLVAEGRLEAAVDVIRRRNPFVSVCGRVCDHPCESPLPPHRPRRAAGHPRAEALRRRPRREALADADARRRPATRQVAVVGAGPAGLSCAYFLALMGRAQRGLREAAHRRRHARPGHSRVPPAEDGRSRRTSTSSFATASSCAPRTPVENVEELFKRGLPGRLPRHGRAEAAARLGIEGEDLDGVADALELPAGPRARAGAEVRQAWWR